MKSFITLLGICLFCIPVFAQSGSAGRPYQRTRAIERTYDLPFITVKAPTPGIASDLTTLVVYAPDSMDIELQLAEWMVGRSPVWQRSLRIGPGRQELQVPLYAVADGAYTIEVLRREQVVSTQHVLVQR